MSAELYHLMPEDEVNDYFIRFASEAIVLLLGIQVLQTPKSEIFRRIDEYIDAYHKASNATIVRISNKILLYTIYNLEKADYDYKYLPNKSLSALFYKVDDSQLDLIYEHIQKNKLNKDSVAKNLICKISEQPVKIPIIIETDHKVHVNTIDERQIYELASLHKWILLEENKVEPLHGKAIGVKNIRVKIDKIHKHYMPLIDKLHKELKL